MIQLGLFLSLPTVLQKTTFIQEGRQSSGFPQSQRSKTAYATKSTPSRKKTEQKNCSLKNKCEDMGLSCKMQHLLEVAENTSLSIAWCIQVHCQIVKTGKDEENIENSPMLEVVEETKPVSTCELDEGQSQNSPKQWDFKPFWLPRTKSLGQPILSVQSPRKQH